MSSDAKQRVEESLVPNEKGVFLVHEIRGGSYLACTDFMTPSPLRVVGFTRFGNSRFFSTVPFFNLKPIDAPVTVPK